MATKRTITLNELNLDITYSVKDDSVRGCHTESGFNLKIGDKVVIDNYFHEIVETPAEEATNAAEPTEAHENTAPNESPAEAEKSPAEAANHNPAEEPAAKISISPGNAKMGAIPSVSLPACITCNPCAPCFAKCYAAKIERLYKNTRNAYARNLSVLQSAPYSYWLQVKAAAMTARFFRYHVSGDIPNGHYFKMMVKTARELPHTTFLAFTKQYETVNDYLNDGNEIPENLKIILSNWGAWKCDNPHSLPTCEIILKGSEPAPDWKICGGNCTACACAGIGCWELKQGETIAIYEH
jgi:hypothetical protein